MIGFLVFFDYDEIISARLWVGGYVRPEDVIELKSAGITSIVNLQTDEDLATCGISLPRLLDACHKGKIEYRRIPTRDFDKLALAVNLPMCVAGLEAALSGSQSRVYLHCTAGINRSPTTAAAYLIRTRGLSAPEAYKYLVERRDCSPYLEILETYAQSLKVPG